MTASQLKSIAATDKKLALINYRTRSRKTNMKTKITNGRHIAAGAIITSQITASSLPSVDSVIRRRRAKANRKKLFNGNHLYIVAENCNYTENCNYAENCIAA